jgi:uncharacterized protein (TIGR03437 family)
VPGQTVTFNASPRAQISPASATTGVNGQASATLRLPMTEGVALATAQAGRQLVTFSARSAAFSLTNFPALSQAVDSALGNGSDSIRQKGALLTSVASILRYHQLRNELPQPNGLADPGTLNQFLKSLCVFDGQGNRICDGFVSPAAGAEQTVNLWRLNAFVGSGLDVRVEQADLGSVRDLVAGGSPVLVALSLASLGSHFAVATGIAGNGDLILADSAFSQPSLNAYLNGFNGPGGAVQGTLSGAVRLLPGVSSAQFLAVNSAPVAISSLAGACGRTLQFPDTAASSAGTRLPGAPGTLYFLACDGAAGPYQLDIASQGAYNGTFTDLSPNGGRAALTGSGPASSEIVRNGANWSLAPLALSISAGGVVNAASLTEQMAPGGLVNVYGAGFVQAGVATTVQINGEQATVTAAFPFQLSVQIPFDIPSGPATLMVAGNGSAQQPIAISDVAPAIFSTSPSQAAIANLDNSTNGPSNPAHRGDWLQIYATGLGVVDPALNLASTPVSVVIAATEIPAALAGLTGVPGVYQVNVQLPSSMPPGLSLPLYLKQGTATSNTVSVAIQ